MLYQKNHILKDGRKKLRVICADEDTFVTASFSYNQKLGRSKTKYTNLAAYSNLDNSDSNFDVIGNIDGAKVYINRYNLNPYRYA